MIKKYNYYLKLYDLAKKTRVNYYFDFFLDTLSWSKEELTQYRLSKLKSLLIYAYDNCPFYRDSFARAGITTNNLKEINSLDYLKYLPVLTREDIQNHPDTLINVNKKQDAFFKGSSSGTTGIPITYYHDKDGFSAGMAAGYFCYTLSDWHIGDRSLHIWGNPTSIKNWNTWGSKIKRWVFQQKNLDATLLNDQANYSKIITRINRFKPIAIDGYTSSIYNLAHYLRENEIRIHRPNVIFTTAENLFPYHKKVIEDALAAVSDIYGCGEINGIAVQPIHSDKYYIIEPHVIVETEYHRFADFHEIIVTDLDNRMMPFIRYKIGDFIDPPQCSDDFNHIKFDFFTKIYGRNKDIIKLSNGKTISAITIVGGTAFRQISGIVKHKAIWDGEYLHFIFETNKHFNLSFARQKIRESICKYENDIKFKIKPVDRILPDKTGKFNYFENKQAQL